MKSSKIVLSILILLILIAFSSEFCIADSETIEYEGKTLKKRSAGKGFIVYGEPEELKGLDMPTGFVKQSYDSTSGEYRYLGISEAKLPFANDKYPADASSGLTPGQKYWIRINLPSSYDMSPFHDNPKYSDASLALVYGMRTSVIRESTKQYQDPIYRDYMNELRSEHSEFSPLTAADLCEFLYVQALPMPGMGGSVIGWNEWRPTGKWYYQHSLQM